MHRSKARFKVLDCGRRWGKTRLGVMECYDVAAQGQRLVGCPILQNV